MPLQNLDIEVELQQITTQYLESKPGFADLRAKCIHLEDLSYLQVQLNANIEKMATDEITSRIQELTEKMHLFQIEEDTNQAELDATLSTSLTEKKTQKEADCHLKELALQAVQEEINREKILANEITQRIHHASQELLAQAPITTHGNAEQLNQIMQMAAAETDPASLSQRIKHDLNDERLSTARMLSLSIKQSKLKIDIAAYQQEIDTLTTQLEEINTHNEQRLSRINAQALNENHNIQKTLSKARVQQLQYQSNLAERQVTNIKDAKLNEINKKIREIYITMLLQYVDTDNGLNNTEKTCLKEIIRCIQQHIEEIKQTTLQRNVLNGKRQDLDRHLRLKNEQKNRRDQLIQDNESFANRINMLIIEKDDHAENEKNFINTRNRDALFALIFGAITSIISLLVYFLVAAINVSALTFMPYILIATTVVAILVPMWSFFKNWVNAYNHRCDIDATSQNIHLIERRITNNRRQINHIEANIVRTEQNHQELSLEFRTQERVLLEQTIHARSLLQRATQINHHVNVAEAEALSAPGAVGFFKPAEGDDAVEAQNMTNDTQLEEPEVEVIFHQEEISPTATPSAGQ